MPRRESALTINGGRTSGVAVFFRMQVQHKVDEGPLQQRPGPAQQGEAGPGDLGGPFEIQDAQVLADIPVGFGGKVEPGGLSPGFNHRVVVAAGTYGHGFVGDIGQIEQEITHPGVIIIYRIIKGFKLGVDCRYLHLNVLSFLIVTGFQQLTGLLRQILRS